MHYKKEKEITVSFGGSQVSRFHLKQVLRARVRGEDPGDRGATVPSPLGLYGPTCVP